MRAKLYHIERLPANSEKQIRETLRKGAGIIIDTLHKHFTSFNPDDTELIFEKVLLQIGKTISEIASLPELNYNISPYKRIAYLPGYTTKEKNRITHKIEWSGKKIASDIAFDIKGVNKSARVKESVTNQALLYHHLLEHFEDDKEFLNGGTHQFLVENATSLETKHYYHLDLVQVFNSDAKKMTLEDDEITFLNISVDFKKQNTVEKLYKYFDTELNKGITQKKWPYNTEDNKLDEKIKASTYKMRGYLVALWYKILHDINKKDINKWFADCVAFAEANAFNHLKVRLNTLQKSIAKKTNEQYSFWYSLVFNPLPNFTVPNAIVKETLGSAMIMTNFELNPAFFFWVQPWINRMYRHIRDFENLRKEIAGANAKLKGIYTGNMKYLPLATVGDRLYNVPSSKNSKGETNYHYKHQKELIFYYQEFFGNTTEEKIKELYNKTMQMVNSIILLHLIQIEYPGIIPIEIEPIKNKYRREVDKILPNQKYGFNSVLKNHEDSINKERFKNRLIGRLATLIFYCNSKYSVEQIHAILIQKARIIGSDMGNTHDTKRNTYAVCRANFFIEGLASSDTDSSRGHSIEMVKEKVAPYEKELIEKWAPDFLTFLNSVPDLDDTTKEKLTKQIAEIER